MTFIVSIIPLATNRVLDYYETCTWVYVAEAEEYYLARKIGSYSEGDNDTTQVHALSKKKWKLHKG